MLEVYFGEDCPWENFHDWVVENFENDDIPVGYREANGNEFDGDYNDFMEQEFLAVKSGLQFEWTERTPRLWLLIPRWLERLAPAGLLGCDSDKAVDVDTTIARVEFKWQQPEHRDHFLKHLHDEAHDLIKQLGHSDLKVVSFYPYPDAADES